MNFSADKSISLLAHAKINLTLDVLSKRDDGYHEIASVMQTISLADRVTVTLTADDGIQLVVTGPIGEGVPSDERNLAYRAARNVVAESGRADRGVSIVLEKRIPSQAGLGGGSSDAAATLRAVNGLLGSPFGIDELTAVATQLGADVPFFLHGGTATVGGIGERVTPIDAWTSPPFVIAKPHVGSDTGVAYDALDGIASRVSANATKDWPSRGLSNDFEAVIFDLYPAIGEARAALVNAGAERVLLCGSGAALVGFGPDADVVAERFRATGLGNAWCVTPTEGE